MHALLVLQAFLGADAGGLGTVLIDILRALGAVDQQHNVSGGHFGNAIAHQYVAGFAVHGELHGVMSNVRFDELELMLMAMFEQKTLKGTIQTLTEVQQLVEEDAEMAVLVQQSIQKLQQLNEQQFKGLELEWYKPDEPNQKVERVADE